MMWYSIRGSNTEVGEEPGAAPPLFGRTEFLEDLRRRKEAETLYLRKGHKDLLKGGTIT